MKNFMLVPFLLTLAALTGCGGGGKSSAKLQVSSSMAITNSFGGGLIIAGSSSTGKKFSISLTGTNTKQIVLDKGVWTFGAVAWDGGSSGNKLYQGNAFCALDVVDLKNDSAVVDLNVTVAGCTNSSFQAALNVKSLRTFSCGVLYAYEGTPKQFIDPAGSDDNFCNNLPTDFKSNLTHFQISPFEVVDGKATVGKPSECLSMTGALPTLNLPTNKIPFLIRIFRSIDYCQKGISSQAFVFKDGIKVGDASEFDHHYREDSSGARLVLPSSVTRRGKSPFMSSNMIPRILCNGSPCFSEPNPQSRIRVNWESVDNDWRSTILAKKTNITNSICPASLFNLKYFGITNCSVKDGSIEAQVHRNQLVCQEVNKFNIIKYIYEKNNFIYVLFLQSGNYFIEKYSETGKLLASSNFLSSYSYTQIAVDDSEQVYAFYGNGYVRISLNGIKYHYEDTHQTVPSASKFDVSSDGNFIFTHNNSNIINAYAYGNTTPITKDYLLNSKQIQFSNGSLYALISNGVNSYLKKSSFNGAFGALETVATVPIDRENFWIADEKIYTTNAGGTLLKAFRLNDGVEVASLSITPTATYTSMVASKNRVYFADGLNSLKVFNYSSSSLNPISTIASTCTEPTTPVLPYGITLETQKDEASYRIMDNLFDILGRQFVTEANSFYYFESLNDDDQETRSGGILGNAQEMLSPMGIAGLFSEFKDCLALKAALPITKNITIFDDKDGGSKNLTVSAQPTSEKMSLYICDDSNPASTNATCNKYYDMTLSYISGNNVKGDTTIYKLKCGVPAGEVEDLRIEEGRTEKRRTLWNTVSDTKARFESFNFEEEGFRKRASIDKLQKTAVNEFWSREVSVELDLGYNWVSGAIHELHLNSVGQIISTRFDINENTSNFNNSPGPNLPNGYTLQQIRENTQLLSLPIANPLECMNKLNTDPLSAHIAGCTTFLGTATNFTQAPSNNGGTVELSISGLYNGSNDIEPEFYNMFKLTLPAP